MRKCKNCKESFEPKNKNKRYCLEPKCVHKWELEANKKEWYLEKKKMLEGLETVSELTKKAQKEFNSFIRERDKDKPCISCEKELVGKFDAGHYFNTQYSSVRFDENNVHGQCVNCNYHKHGALLEYQVGIEKRIGGIELFDLHQKAHEKRTYTKEELRIITKKYRKLKNNLRKNLQD